MKKEINFNHDAKTITEALGVTEDVNRKSKDAIIDFMTDSRSSTSVLAEYIHKSMEYETILMLATHQIQKKMEDAFGGEELKDALKTLASILGRPEVKEDDKASLN